MTIKTPIIAITLLAITSSATLADESYTVASGDSLSQIGRYFGVPYPEIMKANNLSSPNIFVGQKLKIPTNSGRYIVVPEIKEPVIPPPPIFSSSSDEEPIPAIVPQDPYYLPIPPKVSTEPKPLPSVMVKPIHTYPAPMSQERYSIPNAPGYTGTVSPYNDSSATAVTKAAPKKKPVPLKRGRTVQASSQKAKTYVVQRGDSVRSISKEFGVHFWELRTVNDIRFKKLYPGQVLKIP